MPPQKVSPPGPPMHVAGLSATAAGVFGSPPPPLGTLLELAAAFDVLYRHHPHYRRYQERPVPKKTRKPKAGATPVKKPRVKPTVPVGFLVTRIDLSAAPPVTVSGAGFVAEYWPRGQVDAFSNVALPSPAGVTASAPAAVKHTFELTAMSAGLVTWSAGGASEVNADVFGAHIHANVGELVPFERSVGPLLIRGRVGWSGEIRHFGGIGGDHWPTLTWTWRELIDLTPAVRSASMVVLTVNPS